MGGQDKALLIMDGQSVIAHVLARLRLQVDDIVISCNRNEEKMAGFGHRLVADLSPDYPGPLAGIIAGLPYCRHEHVLVAPCDMPFLPINLVAGLSALMTEDIEVVISHDGSRLQPLVMLLRRTLADSLQDYLAGGGHKVETWCTSRKFAVARFDDAPAFINLNTLAELKNSEEK